VLVGAATRVTAAGLAPDQIALSAGYGEHVAVYDVGAVWTVPTNAAFLTANALALRIAADVARWDSRDRGAPVTWLWDVGVTPLLHWTPGTGAWRDLFAEAGIGVNVLSATQLGNVKRFSTALQFGERIALGTAFGARERYEIAAYLQHVSNADIKLPNSGLTQWGAMLRLPLE
jgi:lipid A 3-O-deacylase